ncbi:MAG: SAM-dependent DNA methyltransferase [Anaerolineae bacterium]|nr:SAM-dependent DNA methyltransferase [Anaerolineae bacterium]
MHTVSRSIFTTVKTEGAILPADLLQRVADGRDLDGLKPADYHLAPNERLNEAINRAWNRCLGVWQGFHEQRGRLPASETGTTLTRERWLLILFQELGYGRLPYQGSLPLGTDGDAPRYPISHAWGHAPIHLVTFRQDLDRRPQTAVSGPPSSVGGHARSPHSLVQEYLNRAEGSLWGFLSNGLRLRLLRDNASLTRAAYVEFDLEAMMNGELYADFSLLWLVCHQSRVEAERPAECWLERWSQTAAEQGTRALDALRGGVQEAIAALGRGFLSHRANRDLKAALRSGELSAQDFYRQLLRLVYRLIFLFVAEDRDLLLTTADDGRQTADDRPQTADRRPQTADGRPETDDGTPRSAVGGLLSSARQRYLQYYSVRRLRDLAEAQRGGPHPDLYRNLRLVFAMLRQGYAPLALPGLGSFLFSERSTPALDGADLANRDLLNAIRALAFTIEGRVRRPVDYKNLGAEELGSVYESLLELHPQLNADAGTFALDVAAGSERKTTGSYYTPSSLIRCLLDSALEPVVEDRLRRATADRGPQTADGGPHPAVGGRSSAVVRPSSAVSPQEEAILNIKVVDPAAGSGHFLIAAAHRLARHLARVRTGDEEPAPGELRAALRDVVRHCIHGVDINPMAVELCKVALWMETIDPGKPLSFLDRNIQCGNSLIGATPALLAKGIPDEAFTPIEGDDKAYCSEWKKRNKAQRESQQLSLFAPDLLPWDRMGNLAASMMSLSTGEDDTLDAVQRKQALYEELVHSSEYRYGRLWADAWCAAFVWKKTKEFPYPITEEVFRRVEHNPFDVAPWMVEEIERLREQYQFFHWHLAFPHVFYLPGAPKETENEQAGWNGGFDVVLGNPPWERLNLEDRQFFATTRPDIAQAPTAQRRSLIVKLQHDDPRLFSRYRDAQRTSAAEIMWHQNSGRYAYLYQARLNTYVLFVELTTTICNTRGRCGLIVPSGVVTDSTAQRLFEFLIDTHRLVSVFDFENRKPFFHGIHRSYKFSLLTFSGSASQVRTADFVFFAHEINDLDDQSRHFTLSSEDLRLLSPLTSLCPTFRCRRDREIVLQVYRHTPPFIVQKDAEGKWGSSDFLIMFRSDSSSHLYRTPEELGVDFPSSPGLHHLSVGRLHFLPVWESKLMHQFDHRYATYETVRPEDRAKGKAREVQSLEKNHVWSAQPRNWVVDEEVQSILDKRGWKHPWTIGYRDITNATNERTAIASILPMGGASQPLNLFLPQSPWLGVLWIAAMNSFVLDYIVRQTIGGVHLNITTCRQLPIISQVDQETAIGELIQNIVCELVYNSPSLTGFADGLGCTTPPFLWNEERRFLLRCELDAVYFHLYGIARDDVDYIMDTFPIVKRKDEAAHGEYRTQRVILEIYDEMQQAMDTGRVYQTRLDPPPADPRVAHPA